MPSLGQEPIGFLLHLITAALIHFVDSARADISTVFDGYLFSTTDVSSPGHGALTGRPTLRRMNLGMAMAMDLLIAVVFTYACIRAIFDRSIRSRHGPRIVLPRLLAAIVLIHFSLPFMQMAIDLNNALGRVAMTLGDLPGTHLPWSGPLSGPVIAQISMTENLFHAVFAVALVIAVVILMLAYVVRYALLGILIVTAPMAALCSVLPETVTYSRTWLRLFLVTVFMQAVQLVILRIATVTAMDTSGSTVQTIYSLATLWIVLKVPGALNTASHFETKARTMGHSAGKSMHKAIIPAHHVTHQS